MAKKKRHGGAAQEAARRRALQAQREPAIAAQRAAAEASRVAAAQAYRAHQLAAALAELDDSTEAVARAVQWQDRVALRAREAGASWAQIGRALRISQQAAHRRYAGRSS